MGVNNKRKHAHQMRAHARKRVFWHAFFNTRLRKNCACVLRVRKPLISDLYCTIVTIEYKPRCSCTSRTSSVFDFRCLAI